jgi:site-specific DNA-methyltransferase (adenine-specific)
MNKLIHGNCLDELKKLQDNSIDLVLTDPPYFIHKLDSSWSKEKIDSDKKNSHITNLPKGMKYSKSQVKELFDFYKEVSELVYKKLKPGGYFLSFSAPRLYHSIAMAKEIVGFEVRDIINWVYTQSIPKGMSVNHIIDRMDIPETQKEELKKEYSGFKTPQIKSCHEPICVAMKPIGVTFIQNELNFRTGLLDFNQKVGINSDKVPANIVVTEDFDEIYTKNFLIGKPSKKEKGENSHITVKPIKLLEHLIKIFSKEGSLVVDPFMGSGSTVLACKSTNRNYIGIEIEKEYWIISNHRLTSS